MGSHTGCQETTAEAANKKRQATGSASSNTRRTYHHSSRIKQKQGFPKSAPPPCGSWGGIDCPRRPRWFHRCEDCRRRGDHSDEGQLHQGEVLGRGRRCRCL